MIASRLFTVLAAVCFVAAFAMATLLPPTETLREVLASADPAWPGAIEAFCRTHLSGWLWDQIVTPLIQRPDWLAPAGLGLVFAGLATSLGTGRRVSRSHRRRS